MLIISEWNTTVCCCFFEWLYLTENTFIFHFISCQPIPLNVTRWAFKTNFVVTEPAFFFIYQGSTRLFCSLTSLLFFTSGSLQINWTYPPSKKLFWERMQAQVIGSPARELTQGCLKAHSNLKHRPYPNFIQGWHKCVWASRTPLPSDLSAEWGGKIRLDCFSEWKKNTTLFLFAQHVSLASHGDRCALALVQLDIASVAPFICRWQSWSCGAQSQAIECQESGYSGPAWTKMQALSTFLRFKSNLQKKKSQQNKTTDSVLTSWVTQTHPQRAQKVVQMGPSLIIQAEDMGLSQKN